MGKYTISREVPSGGPTSVSWAAPIPRNPLPHVKLARYHLNQYYWRPAIRAFYTPSRHALTNVRECVRLFYHSEQFQRYLQREVVQMAEKKDTQRSVTWVNYRLDDDDKTALQDEPLDFETVMADFADLVLHGYRLSVSFDSYSNAIQASLVCGAADNPDSGYGMSARHPDLSVALRSLLYKGNRVGWGKWHEFSGPAPVDSWS